MATAQSQNNVVMTTNQQQQVVVPMETGNVKINRLSKKYLKIIKRLSIAEVVLGSVCMIIGVVVIAIHKAQMNSYGSHSYSSYLTAPYTQAHSVGEGLWGGVVIVLAGGMGIAAGGRNSNLCLMNFHMGLSILGAVVSCGVITVEIKFSADHYWYAYSHLSPYISWRIILILLEFASMILLICSASFCCCSNTAFCCTGDKKKTVANGEQVFNNPISMSAQAGNPPGYVNQNYQPQIFPLAMVSMQQPAVYAVNQPPPSASQPIVVYQPPPPASQPIAVNQPPPSASQPIAVNQPPPASQPIVVYQPPPSASQQIAMYQPPPSASQPIAVNQV